jgi:hypothetical protein
MGHNDLGTLALHEHIDRFNESLDSIEDFTGVRKCYVTFIANAFGDLTPHSWGTGITKPVKTKKPIKHKYKGGSKVRKDFYINELLRDCVYILYRDDKPVYVGQSQNVYQRMNQHKKDKQFNRIRILYCRRNRKTYWEKILIQRYNPLYNHTHTSHNSGRWLRP